jgi:hypothetical protein
VKAILPQSARCSMSPSRSDLWRSTAFEIKPPLIACRREGKPQWLPVHFCGPWASRRGRSAAIGAALALTVAGIVAQIARAIGQAASLKPVTVVLQGNSHIQFSVPRSWGTLRAKNYTFTFDVVLVYVGTVPLSQPCSHSQAGRTCEFFPQHPLPPSSVVLNVMSNFDLRTPRGGTATLGGLPGAHISTPIGEGRLQIVYRRSDGCPMKTGRSEQAIVALRHAGGFRLIVTACIRGPSASRFQGQVRALLRSLKWGRPAATGDAPQGQSGRATSSADRSYRTMPSSWSARTSPRTRSSSRFG